jgi:hypothetical protein
MTEIGSGSVKMLRWERIHRVEKSRHIHHARGRVDNYCKIKEPMRVLCRKGRLFEEKPLSTVQWLSGL